MATKKKTSKKRKSSKKKGGKKGRAIARGFAARPPTSQPAKKKRRRKKKAAKKVKGAGKAFKTKVQVGRRKVVAKCPPGAILVETGVARKDSKGRKHIEVGLMCVRGRSVRR